MDGLLIVDKPVGPTSMDVIRVLRRCLRERKIGHAGTLDPLASGVVVCAVGRATKSIDRLMGLPKAYETTIDLAAFTATDDVEAPREPVTVASPPSLTSVRGALDAMTGQVLQRPPAFSAIHVKGQRAYDLARAGETLSLPPRPVRIDAITILSYAYPSLSLRVSCGKGVYIRSIARELGERLSTGGHLTALRRTRIGPYDVGIALPLSHAFTAADLLPVPPGDGPPAS